MKRDLSAEKEALDLWIKRQESGLKAWEMSCDIHREGYFVRPAFNHKQQRVRFHYFEN